VRSETIERWLNIGKALVRIQQWIMHEARTNVPKGRRYNDVQKRLGLNEHVPHLCQVDPASRSHAIWLVQEWSVVGPWLNEIEPRRRLQWNHPTTIKRQYEAHLARLAQAKAEKTKALAEATRPPAQQDSPMDLVKMLRTGIFKPGTAMTEVADTLEAGLSYDALKRLHAEIGKRIANAERQDRIEAGAKNGRK
jgi:hypothetical protein